ncbi:MAG: hypothetical protein NTV42_00655, partial [Chloroflexi bacterium]|nr:hypothetical protein [Chloroflexota bacterium]
MIETTPDGGAIYLAGDGASAEGDRPFLDRLDLARGEVEVQAVHVRAAAGPLAVVGRAVHGLVRERRE